MNNKFAILLGGNILNIGVYDKFKENNLDVIVVDWNDNPPIYGDKHLKIDVKDYHSIINELSKMGLNKDDFVVAYTSIDLAALTISHINEFFNKCYTPIQTIKKIESKEAMKTNWEKSNLFNRLSVVLSDHEDIEKILNTFNSKNILIKPSIASSSRGLSVVDKNDKMMVDTAFKKAQNVSIDGKVMLEEFIEGTEFTIELLGDNFGNVCVYAISKKYHTANTNNNRIAIKLHYSPNDVLDSNLNKIAKFGIKCYKSLGLKNCFGHLEVIQKNNGEIVPIEIGARSSGFIASHLVDIVSGKNYISDYISVINGKKIENDKYYKTNFSSMYFFYDIPSEKTSINTTNLMDFIDKSIVSLYSNRKMLTKGNKFALIDNDNARVGYEILMGKSDKLTIENIAIAENKFLKSFLG